ncbi:MAG: LysR family transcriptional regulator [Gammaproteobacteria bacterium]|uniref:LysR family transcriptional regulator n=1 Tax=Nevskia sp. TaxID=1929292 RepID=UPI0040360F05|nr:LysR family transcriptional regulator [Gammaproteobacteria bacterium]
MDWDDLRYVLAISRAGGLNGAARALGVNPSSVYRRLEALEKTLEVRLFERLRAGYRLTPGGEALAEAAGRMEREALGVENRIKGTDVRLEGHLRVSTSEAVTLHLLPRWLAEFRDTYPGLTLDIASTNQIVDLSKREADVVIRGTDRPPPHLVGRRCAPIVFAAYASTRYLDKAGRGRPLADYEWLGFDGPMLRVQQAKWLAEQVPESRIRLRYDSFAPIRLATAAGLGCAALPCFACEEDPALERLPGTMNATTYHFWVLTHPDLRRSARVRAFLQFFGTRLAALDESVMGAAATPA